MLYSIGQCYCTHSFFLRVSCFLCQFVAVSVSFEVVSPCSRWFQFVPGSSSLFHLVSGATMLSPVFLGWNLAITWLLFHACTYQLKSYWMDIKFFNENKFLNECNIFEWKQNFWMKSLKLIKPYKIEGKSKLIIIETKTYYWINMSLLHKHPVIAYKIKIFEWKSDNWMKLLNELNISTKLLNENSGCKWTRIEFCYILAGIGRRMDYADSYVTPHFTALLNRSRHVTRFW